MLPPLNVFLKSFISHDASVMLQVLYKLKTAKLFEKARCKEEKAYTEIVDEDPFAIQLMTWCADSRMLCVAGVSAHVIIYRFSKLEMITEVIQVKMSVLLCTNTYANGYANDRSLKSIQSIHDYANNVSLPYIFRAQSE